MRSTPFRVFAVIGLPVLLTASAQPGAAQPAAARTKEEAALLAAPTADLISPEFLAPAVRQALANGVATLVARITAEGNDHGLAFPPSQTSKFIEMVELPARRVQVEEPIYKHEYAEVEKIVPVVESGQPTGRFTRAKVRVIVKTTQVGKRMTEHLRPDPNGTEIGKWPKYGPGGPAAWSANLAGLNGMALYVLAKAGLENHPATLKHAEALAAHASEYMGLPDATFDVAWMAAGFAALGPNSKHEQLAERLVGKLLDGQVREKGPLDGLWGPVCVNYGYYGKLFMLGQTVRQELDVHIPKKLELANPAQQQQLVEMGKEMRAVASAYEKTHRGVFRCGTQMLKIGLAYPLDDEVILPGLPLNAYQWVVTDVESTEAATFALAEAKRKGLLPRETERLAIRGKKIHAPVKPEAVFKAAAKRLAEAIDADGGCSALALMAANTGFKNTGFPAPAFADGEALRPLFDVQTACTCVAAEAAIESLRATDPDLGKLLDEPRQRSRARAAEIAARWYEESANPAADAWKGMYQASSVAHADLKKSPGLPAPESKAGSSGAQPWGPAGCLYRILPGFRGLFAEQAAAGDRLGDDLFRRIAYRLVALQDPNGQWSSSGSYLLSTASESLTIQRVAEAWHRSLTRDPPGKIPVADPAPYQSMLHPQYVGWSSHSAAWADAAVFPTLASLVFLLEAADGPVSLDGIAILPEAAPEPAPKGDGDTPPPRLTPLEAVKRVVRPNGPRDELFAAIVATRWPRSTAAAAAPAAVPPAAGESAAKSAVKPEKDEPPEDDGLGKFEDLLVPSAGQK